MNLTDLRAELARRAGESGARPHPDLLPGVREKIRTTKRNRRVAGTTAVLAALVAVVVGLMPTLNRDRTPDPAHSPPSDVVANGVTFEGAPGDGSTLQKAFVGNRGQTSATFEWTPASTQLKIALACGAERAEQADLRVTVGGLPLAQEACSMGLSPAVTGSVGSDSGLWTVARPGRPTTVTVELVSPAGVVIGDPSAILGVGIYTSAPAERDPMPVRTPPASPGDYVVDGFRYRKQVGGSTLVKAVIGEQGQDTVTFEFTPSSNRLHIGLFCLGGKRLNGWLKINGQPAGFSRSCGLGSSDLGAATYAEGVPGLGWPEIRVGQPNTITVWLGDADGTPLSGSGAGSARIGAAVYERGELRVVGSGPHLAEIDTLVEHRGYLYRLADLRSVEAATVRQVSVPTPGGAPFLVRYGATDLGAEVTLRTDGLDDTNGMTVEEGGSSLEGQPARPAGTATVMVSEGKPTRGKLYLAVYELVR